MAEIFELNPEQTEFNGGLAKVFRLDAIQKQIHLARVNKNYSQWYEWLLSKYLELVIFLTDKTAPDYDKVIKDMSSSYFQIQKLMDEKKKVPYDLFGAFYAAEVELAKLEHKNGLGIKKVDSRYGS